jgi:hypothetical protein
MLLMKNALGETFGLPRRTRKFFSSPKKNKEKSFPPLLPWKIHENCFCCLHERKFLLNKVGRNFSARSQAIDGRVLEQNQI